jgi:polyphosphate kinase 2 (PPK2 family)
VVFNRSHYEDVLVPVVKGTIDKRELRRRYAQIVDFERMLVETGTVVCKFMLHISKGEQRERLQARLDDPTKRWKFKTGDLEERKRWDDYMAAYSDALGRCSTDDSPWYAIPADRKWFRNLAIAEIVADELERLDPRYPARDDLPKDLVIE